MCDLYSSIAIVTLLGSVRCEEADPVPVQAQARVTAGERHLFSGEDIQLACSVPEDPLSGWRYQWFLNGVLVSSSEVYDLKDTQVLQTGGYTCLGEKDIDGWPYVMKSLPSDVLNVHVDGGWVLLQTPTEPLVIEEVLNLTCRVRDDPLLMEVTFYKGDVKNWKQKDKDLVFPRVSLEDQGSYWCKATWVQGYVYHSGQSLPASVTVLDKLTSPVLELEPGRTVVAEGSSMVLKCSTQLHAREQGHGIEYYYMKNGTRLGPASSRDTHTIQSAVKDDTGVYTCKVRVRALNLERWSNELKVEVKPRDRPKRR